jgi:hypothetical protein
MVVFLFNIVIYVFLLLCLCILIACLCIFVPAGTLRLPWLRVFLCFFPQLQGKCQAITCKDRAWCALFRTFCLVLYIVCFVSFCVWFVCKCVLYHCHRVATQLQLTNVSYQLHDMCQGHLQTYKHVMLHNTWVQFITLAIRKASCINYQHITLWTHYILC